GYMKMSMEEDVFGWAWAMAYHAVAGALLRLMAEFRWIEFQDIGSGGYGRWRPSAVGGGWVAGGWSWMEVEWWWFQMGGVVVRVGQVQKGWGGGAVVVAQIRWGGETLPPVLDSTSQQPPLFDGTIRLYTAYPCPYAQRVWVALNYKGLQNIIQLVPISLTDKPTWYKDVYPPNKVPALEHNNEIKGESLDLLKYLDTHFEGPKLFPDDPAKKEFAEEMLAYAGTFCGTAVLHLKGGPEPNSEMIADFDKLEEALSKFDDGPFFLGQFSAVCFFSLYDVLPPFLNRCAIIKMKIKTDS
ncbi:Protein IN2-1-like protein B, partial [Bienertia sinuspersici]